MLSSIRKVMCISLLLLSYNAAGTPIINNVVIDLNNDGDKIIRVFGSGFGSEGAEILAWDDFEAQTVGQGINGSNSKLGRNWSTQYSYSGAGAVWDDGAAVSGSVSAKIDWSEDANSIRAFGFSGTESYTQLFISYWRKMQGDYDSERRDNHKQFYLFGDNAQFPQLMPLIPAGGNRWGVYNNVGDPNVSFNARNNINSKNWNYSNTRDVFQRWSFYVALNTPGQYDGTIKGWLNGQLGIDTETYQVAHVVGGFRDFRLGHMARGFESTAKAWFDDVYVATSQARIELCDAAKWSECSEAHILPTASSDWTDSELAGEYRNVFESEFFLYVVDSSGNVNQSGFLVRPSGSPPKPPFFK